MLSFYHSSSIHCKNKGKTGYLLEELRHLTHQAGVALHLAFVPVRQEEVTQQWGVRQRLNDAVHKARVAQVYQTTQAWENTEERPNKSRGKTKRSGRTSENDLYRIREKEFNRGRSFFLAATVPLTADKTHTNTVMSLRQQKHRETIVGVQQTRDNRHRKEKEGEKERKKRRAKVGEEGWKKAGRLIQMSSETYSIIDSARDVNGARADPCRLLQGVKRMLALLAPTHCQNTLIYPVASIISWCFSLLTLLSKPLYGLFPSQICVADFHYQ